MKILLCHNYYQQPGGEGQVFTAEANLLKSRGHEVIRYTLHNDSIHSMGRLESARRALWNKKSYTDLRTILRRERPQVMHCTNTFPLISPAAYHAAQSEGVKVVQSLHNYRLLCPGALLMRDGSACESCLGKRFAWPSILHGCYRESRAATTVVACTTAAHRMLGTWTQAVDRYIALTRFARDKFIEGGLPAQKISIKGNFVAPDPGFDHGREGYAIFVGRLSPEKGIDTLLDAWRALEDPLPLKIVGAGPLESRVQDAAKADRRIEWLGRRSHEEVLEKIGAASLLVFPSKCYETFGLTMAEAFAKGTPVVASRLGAMAELVDEGRTGHLFTPADPHDLATTLTRAIADRKHLAAMRRAARLEYEQNYTPGANYDRLMLIYRQAIEGSSCPVPTSPVISFRQIDDATLGGTLITEPSVPVA